MNICILSGVVGSGVVSHTDENQTLIARFELVEKRAEIRHELFCLGKAAEIAGDLNLGEYICTRGRLSYKWKDGVRIQRVIVDYIEKTAEPVQEASEPVVRKGVF